MGFAGDIFADLVEVQLHGFGIGGWQNQGRSGAPFWTDGAEQVGVLIALIGRQTGPCTLACPDADASILLANPRFILEPDLDRGIFRQLGYVCSERVGEVFLKASITSGSCAGCCGRPEMCVKPSSAR